MEKSALEIFREAKWKRDFRCLRGKKYTTCDQAVIDAYYLQGSGIAKMTDNGVTIGIIPALDVVPARVYVEGTKATELLFGNERNR